MNEPFTSFSHWKERAEKAEKESFSYGQKLITLIGYILEEDSGQTVKKEGWMEASMKALMKVGDIFLRIEELEEENKGLQAALFCPDCKDGSVWDGTVTEGHPFGRITPCPTCGELRKKLREGE